LPDSFYAGLIIGSAACRNPFAGFFPFSLAPTAGYNRLYARINRRCPMSPLGFRHSRTPTLARNPFTVPLLAVLLTPGFIWLAIWTEDSIQTAERDHLFEQQLSEHVRQAEKLRAEKLRAEKLRSQELRDRELRVQELRDQELKALQSEREQNPLLAKARRRLSQVRLDEMDKLDKLDELDELSKILKVSQQPIWPEDTRHPMPLDLPGNPSKR
jgi:hypothetical protein